MEYAVNSIHKTIADTLLNSIISQPSLSKPPTSQPSFNPISYPDKATNQSHYVLLISVIPFQVSCDPNPISPVQEGSSNRIERHGPALWIRLIEFFPMNWAGLGNSIFNCFETLMRVTGWSWDAHGSFSTSTDIALYWLYYRYIPSIYNLYLLTGTAITT